MKATTIRIPENTKESIDSEADEYDLSTSEYIRELIEYGREYYGEEDLIAELESEVEEIADERDELAEKVEELEAELSERPDTDTPALKRAGNKAARCAVPVSVSPRGRLPAKWAAS